MVTTPRTTARTACGGFYLVCTHDTLKPALTPCKSCLITGADGRSCCRSAARRKEKFEGQPSLFSFLDTEFDPNVH